MKGFSMGVTTVYITEATTLECELWVAAELSTLLNTYNKIKRQLRGETHRWKTPYTSPELMRFFVLKKLSWNMNKESQ